MTSHATTTPGAWPTNLGAYAKAITGALPLIPAGLLTTTTLDAPTLAAFATASAAHLGLLLAGNPTLKKVITVTGTVAAALILGAAQYEGEAGLSLASVAQWDFTDLTMILTFTLASVLHLTVPNAPATYPTAPDVETAGLLPEPETAEEDALAPRVAPESVTSMLPVISAVIPAARPTVEADVTELENA